MALHIRMEIEQVVSKQAWINGQSYTHHIETIKQVN